MRKASFGWRNRRLRKFVIEIGDVQTEEIYAASIIFNTGIAVASRCRCLSPSPPLLNVLAAVRAGQSRIRPRGSSERVMTRRARPPVRVEAAGGLFHVL